MMNRKNIGQTLFWLGILGLLLWQGLTWFQNPVQKIHTAEELSGTIYSVDGALWWIRSMGAGIGLMFSIMGVLVFTGTRGSYTWLLGILPVLVLQVGMSWTPQYSPPLFGISGGIILLSYLLILWAWMQTHNAYIDTARTGQHIQLVGYTVLVVTAMLLCMYFGNPNVTALAEFPVSSGQGINLSFGLGMLLLGVGHALTARGMKRVTDRPQAQSRQSLRIRGQEGR